MAQVTITINSREYAIACDAGEEVHIMQLAKMLEEKAKLLTANGTMINENLLLAMSGLLLADELSELKKTMQQRQTAAKESTPDFTAFDEKIATEIESLTERINLLAKKMEML